jgi:hypothetical protein
MAANFEALGPGRGEISQLDNSLGVKQVQC